MAGIREWRLGREADQDRDGLHVAPLADSSSADDVRELPPIAWSDLTVDDSTPNSSQGKLYSESGYGVAILQQGSDPNTLVTISFGQGFYQSLGPGQVVKSPRRFTRFFLKRSAGLPLTGQTFKLVVIQNRNADVKTFGGGTSQQAGAAQGQVWVNGKTDGSVASIGNVAVGLFSQRSTRWEVEIKNQGPVDAYLAFSALNYTQFPAQGFLLAAGERIKLRTSTIVYACDPTNTGAIVSAMEVYS